MSSDPVKRWGLWDDKESLEELIVAKLFHVAPSDDVAAMLANKDRCYEYLKKHHIDDIFSFVQSSTDRRNPYPDLWHHWEADHFGNKREILDVKRRIAYWMPKVWSEGAGVKDGS